LACCFPERDEFFWLNFEKQGNCEWKALGAITAKKAEVKNPGSMFNF
jgi:hypothetical protein